jgi:hypothetical protein
MGEFLTFVVSRAFLSGQGPDPGYIRWSVQLSVCSWRILGLGKQLTCS